MKRAIKVCIVVTMILAISVPLFGCASMTRCTKSLQSDVTGGLDRTVTVYSYDGKIIAQYEGKIDISEESDTEVMFDLNGKRTIITNGIVITQEK